MQFSTFPLRWGAACFAALLVCSTAQAQEQCDLDGDGVQALGCGGTDCDDNDETVFPDAEEVDADGIDQDCDGLDFCRTQWVQGGCAAAPGVLPGAAAWTLALVALGARRRR